MRRPRPCQSSPHLALEQAARIDASAGRSGQTGPVSCPPRWLGTCGRGLATYGWAMPLAPGAGRKCPIPRPNTAQSFRACAGRPAPAGRSNSHHNAADHQRSGRKAESCDQFDPEWREDDTSKAGTNIGPTGATVLPTLAFRRFQRLLRFEIRGMLFSFGHLRSAVVKDQQTAKRSLGRVQLSGTTLQIRMSSYATPIKEQPHDPKFYGLPTTA